MVATPLKFCYFESQKQYGRYAMSTSIAKTEVTQFDISMMTEEEKTELSSQIDSLIDRCSNNRQAVNRLVFESMAAMTAGEELEHQLTSKKGLRRLIGAITGSNKALQDKINENASVAQYASQQILQKLAEQNAMSFELITAVNNKLNTSLIATKEEFNSVYDYMARIVKTTRGELVAIQKQLDKVAKNVDLLNWRDSIEYQQYGNRDYTELEPEEKIVCLARDFFDLTGGNWSTADLLLLKSAMKDVELDPKDKTNYFGFIKRIHADSELKDRLLNGKQIISQPDALYLTLFGGMQKLKTMAGDEHYLVDTVKSILPEKADDAEIEEQLTKNYLIQETGCNVDGEVENYDLLLELIYNIEQAEMEGVVGEASAEEISIPEEDIGRETEGKTRKELVELAYEYYCKNNREKAWKIYETADSTHGNTRIIDITKEVFKDPESVFAFCQYGAEKGIPPAERLVGICYEEGIGVEKDLNETVRWWRKAAEQGYADAQCNLGYCYESGNGVEKDLNEAVKWYRKAAEQGQARAQCNLGYCYECGKGLEKDLNEAVKWYRKAAEQGYDRAQYNLGVCYDNGEGVDQNYNEAVKWYRKAAEQGYADAQYNLGVCYDNGEGVNQDYKEAVKWYRKAAEQGNAEAQHNLGVCYANGKGVDQNYNEAVKWYRKAAEQGNASAQNNLGVCYELGNGVEEDHKKAFEWYQKAADQDDTQGICNLGLCYQEGIGVEEDIDEAISLFERASELGSTHADTLLDSAMDEL